MARQHKIPEAPAVSTRSLRPYPDGRVPGIDGSVWLWGSIPLGSIRDAKSDNEKERLGARIHAAFEELSLLTPSRIPNRKIAKSNYREFQLLALNVPVWFDAPHELETRELLNSYFSNELVVKRVVMLGVKLRPSASFKGFRSFMDEVALTFAGEKLPMSDFDDDFAKVQRAFKRAEVDAPLMSDLRFADSWWNWSMQRATPRATPYVPHADHMHFLKTNEARYAVERVGESTECRDWPQELVDNPDQVAVTFGAVESFALEYSDSLDPRSHWGVRLLESDARVVSIRGLVEPSRITREELRRQKRQYEGVDKEFGKINKATPHSSREHLQELEALEEAYSKGGAPATLTDTSVIVGFDGVVSDLTSVTPSGMSIDPMTNRQEEAFHEVMVCSSVRANPHLLDLPATTVAYSGISSLSSAGDRTGALAGFTELDRQPVWVSGSPQSIGDSLPIMEVAATTGSGKLLPLDSELPTPTGRIRMGDVQVGTVLLGRDGLPCTVIGMSPVDPNPELYRLTLSDRQEIDACFNHQFVVMPSRHREGLFNLRRTELALHTMALGYPRGVPIDLDELLRLLREALGSVGCPWVSVDHLRATLRLMDCDADVCDGVVVLTRLKARTRFLGQERELLGAGETVMSVGEMLAVGGTFSIRAHEGTYLAVKVLRELEDRYPQMRRAGRFKLMCQTDEQASQLLRLAREAGRVAVRTENTVVWHAGEQWFTIESIDRIASRPGRCISVDSPDSTYLVADWVPTHNTMLLLWLAHQWHLLGHPQLLLDPKQTSDHSSLVELFGGTVRAFDELEGSDGPLDPIRFSLTPQVGVQLASDMLMQVSPWGGADQARRFETDVSKALHYGVLERGARSTGEALLVAERDGVIDDSITRDVWRFVDSNPMFQVTFGRGAAETPMQLGSGMTLFMVGSAQFEMPNPESRIPLTQESAIKRSSANAVRMLIRAATSQLAGRQGIIHIDEAWMVELLAPGETQQLGRLARSMDVFPILYNQTPSTAVEAGVQNYVSRGFLGYLNSPVEARAGLELFGMGDNEDVYRRVLTPRGDPGRPDGMNWGSLQHLYSKEGKRKIARGSVFYHSDSLGRIAATEIVLPPSFLELASTNPDDIRARKARMANTDQRANSSRM